MLYYDVPKIYKYINNDNYLSNCYKHLTKIKGIHFLFILIELLLNILQELEAFSRNFILNNLSQDKTNLNIISFFTINFNKIKSIIKLVSIFGFIIIFDGLYTFIKIKKFKLKYISISIIVNVFELFIYRTFNLIFFNFFFTLKKEYFLIGCIILILHIYLITKNFLYNHLYYFVPEFIEYPYDEFSSIFDLILIVIKTLISASSTTNNKYIGKFFFLNLFCLQIIFSLYFIYKLRFHSFLFMKNFFLNISKVGLFFCKTIIIFIALLFGKNDILNPFFLIISICIFLVIMPFMYFLYNPFSFIIINRETPMENVLFYLYILSQKSDLEFLFENKLNFHYESCGICHICKKYLKYINKYNTKNNIIEEEKETFINEKNKFNNDNEKTEEKLIDLFDIISDKDNKYFKLIKRIIIDYKQNEKESFIRNSYYFINLSFLIYSDYQKKNYTLSLNERLILEIMNKENNSFLDNHETQISQVFFCNQFIILCNKILEQ